MYSFCNGFETVTSGFRIILTPPCLNISLDADNLAKFDYVQNVHLVNQKPQLFIMQCCINMMQQFR